MDKQEISPYRMAQLLKIASGISEKMLAGIWHLTYQEIDIVMNILTVAIERSQNAGEESN